MQHEDSQRRSRWILRVMEWDEPKARYPNIWFEGMPCHVLLLNRVAGRLRLGDLVAVYHPQSQHHKERSEKFVGLARVVGLRQARQSGSAWADLETAHLLRKPLAVEAGPHRVFLCCDPGWPAAEVALFQKVADAAIAEGWQPQRGELDSTETPIARSTAESTAGRKPDASTAQPGEATATTTIAAEPTPEGAAEPAAEPAAPTPLPKATAKPEPGGKSDKPAQPALPAKPKKAARPAPQPLPGERLFAGADYSGDMRDPKDRTWLAVLGFAEDRLRVIRLQPTGRAGLQAGLRDPDAVLSSAEAIGMDFPFALPLSFAESLLEGPYPEEGWWALVKRLERMTRPAFLAAVHEFRDAHGEQKRLTDESAHSLSPLHRGKFDLSPTTYHGMRMIGEDRSRYAVRPFESAQGRLLLEVSARVSARGLLAEAGESKSRAALIARLQSLPYLPVKMGPEFLRQCRDRTAALDAVIAARSAAVAVLTGEADKTPEDLAPGQGDRVRREGWIYGLNEPRSPAEPG